VVAEAETGAWSEPAVEVFDAQARGLYAVSLGPLEVSEGLTVPISVPRAGEWTAWVRARTASPATLSASDFGATDLEGEQWAWVALPNAAPADGGVEVTLDASAPGVEIDCIALTTGGAPPAGDDIAAPAAVEGLSAQAEGQYATRLSWEAVDAQDLHHYNVYAARGGEVEIAQEYLVGSPEDAEYLDWGLKSGEQYAYLVTAVDRAGNESAASPVATVRTEPVQPRLFVEVEREWRTAEQSELEIPFTMAEDGSFVVWGHVQTLEGNENSRVEMLLDGEPVDTPGISFQYISVGHGGPVLNTWLWDCMRPGRDGIGQPMAYEASAGDHVLTLRAAEGLEVLYDHFVVTNDLGYEPEGTVDFLVQPREE
jgi:hypothetical protein